MHYRLLFLNCIESPPTPFDMTAADHYLELYLTSYVPLKVDLKFNATVP